MEAVDVDDGRNAHELALDGRGVDAVVRVRGRGSGGARGRVRADLLGAPAMSTCTASRVVPYELHMTRTENTKVHTWR